MTLTEIKRALDRSREPYSDGIYHVFSSFASNDYRYDGAIQVWHGPRGGYKRPRRVTMNPTTGELKTGNKFYWNNYHVWLTEKEFLKNEKS